LGCRGRKTRIKIMKITKSKLKSIILEEVRNTLAERGLIEGELEEGMAKSALVALALALSGPAMAGTPDVAPIQQTGDPAEAEKVNPAALGALQDFLMQINTTPEDALEKIVDHEVDSGDKGSGE